MPSGHVYPLSSTLTPSRVDAIGCAVIGYGYWGRVLSSKISADPRYELNVICDRARARADDSDFLAQPRFVMELDEVLSSPDVEAVFIATPPSTHYMIAERSLMYDKHVWLEKPCGVSSEELDSLIKLASGRGLALYLDLIMVSHPLITSLRARVDELKNTETQLGGSYGGHKLRMWRENAGHVGACLGDPFDIIYDLGVHDLSIVKLLYPDLKADEIKLEVDLECITEDVPYPHA